MTWDANAQLDFHTNKLWRSPLERTLVKTLIKKPSSEISIERGKWKIDGLPVSLDGHKRLSCLHSSAVIAFHHIKLLHCPYREKYKRAIQSLDTIQEEAVAAKEASKAKALAKAQLKQKACKDYKTRYDNSKRKAEEEKQKLSAVKVQYHKDRKKLTAAAAAFETKEQLLKDYADKRQKAEGTAKELSYKIATFVSHEREKDKQLKDTAQAALKALKDLKDYAETNFENISVEQIRRMAEKQAAKAGGTEEELALRDEEFAAEKREIKRAIEYLDQKIEDYAEAFEKRRREFYRLPRSIRDNLPPLEELEDAAEAKPELSSEDESPKAKAPGNASRKKVKRELPDREPQLSAQEGLEGNKIGSKNSSEEASANDIGAVEAANPEAAKFIQEIKERANEHIGSIWEALFSNYDPEVIVSCKITSSGTCEITLKEPLRLWISSKNEGGIEDPAGGVIFLLGHNDKRRIKFKLKKDHMEFPEGFSMFIKTPIWARAMLLGFVPAYLTPVVESISFKNEGEVTLTGKAMGKKKPRSKPLSQYLTNWGQKAEVIDPKESNIDAIKRHLSS